MNVFHRLGVTRGSIPLRGHCGVGHAPVGRRPFRAASSPAPSDREASRSTISRLSKAEHALAALNVPPSAMVIVLQSTTAAKGRRSEAFETAAATAIARVPQGTACDRRPDPPARTAPDQR